MTEAGITSFGAYVPRLRLERASVVAANGWANPGLAAYGRGVRSMCNWDEDTITMAVQAARDCLTGRDRRRIAVVELASTSLPFADRLNSGVVAEALNLSENVATMDVTASQRAGTSGLLQALRAAGQSGRTAATANEIGGREGSETLFIASEHRRTRAASPQELLYGDGAVALSIGCEAVIARLVASRVATVDFVDHYRADDSGFDYVWEERWVRDEGYMKIVPPIVSDVLQASGVAPAAVDRFILPCPLPRVSEAVARRAGLRAESVADTLHAECGDTGAAHALVLFARALEDARPGERLLVVGFGQGCDALLFEVTEDVARLQKRLGVSGSLARARRESRYDKFLAFNDLVAKDYGKRAEVDKQTALSTLYRNRKMLTGFVGGRCTRCGTLQFPKARYCVNPDCDALDTQEDYPMADVPGRVMTWTADSLTFAVDPPAYFGMVQFEGGARLMVDFTDVDRASFDVGTPVTMEFRVREVDSQRGFKKYFWKAVPSAAS